MVRHLGRLLYCVCRRSSYGGRKRSRSQGRVLDTVEEVEHEGQETVAHSMAWKAEGQEAARKRQRSSNLAKPQVGEASYAGTPVGRRTRSCLAPKVEDSRPAGHEMQQKTVLKSEKCAGCTKRMKFGKIVLRCAVCKVGVHQECALRVPVACGDGEPAQVRQGIELQLNH